MALLGRSKSKSSGPTEYQTTNYDVAALVHNKIMEESCEARNSA